MAYRNPHGNPNSNFAAFINGRHPHGIPDPRNDWVYWTHRQPRYQMTNVGNFGALLVRTILR
jgi:hypothetical protein